MPIQEIELCPEIVLSDEEADRLYFEQKHPHIVSYRQ